MTAHQSRRPLFPPNLFLLKRKVVTVQYTQVGTTRPNLTAVRKLLPPRACAVAVMPKSRWAWGDG